MEELIKISRTDHGRDVVSARDLHAFLESRQHFMDWIKNRIEKYGFVENEDFKVFHNLMKNPNGGRPLTEYSLTLDCAKELSMVEGNEKGKQARRYFIECERRLRETPRVRDPRSQALIHAITKMDLLEQEQERQSGRLDSLENRLSLAEARTQPENDHYTVLGWAKLIDVPLPLNLASKLGKRCSAFSRGRGLRVGRASDPRFGAVNTYHESVLDEAFDEFFSHEPFM